MTFLLDANVLIDFQNSDMLPALVRAARIVDLAVADAVFEEVAIPRVDDSEKVAARKRQAAKALQGARITTIEILPGTREVELMEALLGPLKSLKKKDHGEAASIAIAANNADLLFVTGDKMAVLLALNELFHKGERVMRVPIFVRTLLEHKALDVGAVKEVEKLATSHGFVPSWWASWLAAL